MSDVVSILLQHQPVPEFRGKLVFAFSKDEYETKALAWNEVSKTNVPTLTVCESRGFPITLKPAGAGYRKDHTDTHWQYRIVKWINGMSGGIAWERMPDRIVIDGITYRLLTWWGYGPGGSRLEVTGYHHPRTGVLGRDG